jgi:hypothetical protein
MTPIAITLHRQVAMKREIESDKHQLAMPVMRIEFTHPVLLVKS